MVIFHSLSDELQEDLGKFSFSSRTFCVPFEARDSYLA